MRIVNFRKYFWLKQGLPKFSFQNTWQLIKIIMLIQVSNIVINYFVWLVYRDWVEGWTIAALSIGYTVLILVIKKAQENASKTSLK